MEAQSIGTGWDTSIGIDTRTEGKPLSRSRRCRKGHPVPEGKYVIVAEVRAEVCQDSDERLCNVTAGLEDLVKDDEGLKMKDVYYSLVKEEVE